MSTCAAVESSSQGLNSLSAAYETVKAKINALGRKIEVWTHATFPAPVAKCVFAIIKLAPIALALLILPSSLVLGTFALGAVVHIICPKLLDSFPQHRSLFANAAKVIGIYAAIMAIYNAIAVSFCGPLSIIAMAGYLAMAGASFYAAYRLENKAI